MQQHAPPSRGRPAGPTRQRTREDVRQPLDASTSASTSNDHRTGAQPGIEHHRGSDSASLSPWTGVSDSSDFEQISDSEVRVLSAPPPFSSSSSSLPPSASNLARSLSARTRAREDSYASTASSASMSRGRRLSAAAEEDESRRGIEGDDEDSSAFEDAQPREGADGERGRGRTRRVDPQLKRSMLEDALRSSLATLLSLAPGQPNPMSQTPSMSHASLTSLLSSSFQPTASSSSVSAASSRAIPPGHRPSPFASALTPDFDDDEEEEEEELSRPSSAEDVFLSSSSSSDASEDGEATQLGPSRPIPMSASSSRQRRSYPSSSSAPNPALHFSPLQPSRPLGGGGTPTSGSPPTWSRRRGSGAGATTGRRRGRGRGGSASPGPASIEERRRARALAQAAGGGAAGAEEGRERRREGVQTEGEGEEGRDEAFADLLTAARFFSDLSPRASRTLPPRPSHPSSSSSAAGINLPASSSSTSTEPLFPSWTSATASSRPLSASAPHPFTCSSPYVNDDNDEEEEEDAGHSSPALASESAPTVEGLSSSGAESGRSRSPTGTSPGTALSEERRGRYGAPGASASASEGEEGEKGEKKEKGKEKGKEKRRRGGILGWLRGLGSAVVELKVWHLVGIAGVLIGVGLGAGTLLRALSTSQHPLFTLLDSTSSSSGSLIKVPPRLACFAASSSSGGGGGRGEGGEKMSSLFT